MTESVRRLAARILLAVLLVSVVAMAGVMEVRAQVVVVLVCAIGAAFVATMIAARLRVARQGYRVDMRRDDRVVYEESSGLMGTRRMVFDGDIGPRRRLVHVPRPTRWDDETPPWAHGRRSEILRRLEEACGPGNLAFVDED